MVRPAVRLDGFADEWEEILLGEHCSFSKGSGFSKSDITRDGMPLLLYGTLYTDYRSEIHHVAHKAEPKSDMVVSKGNEVVVPASGETPDDIARASAIREPGIILGGDLNIVRPGPRVDPSFLALAISNGVTQRELASKAQGKSVVHLRNPDLREQSVFVPTIGEQKAIAEYARNLDAAITQSEVRLEKLCQYKQTMLHKMFPSGTSRVPEIRFEGFEGEWEYKPLGELLSDVGYGANVSATAYDGRTKYLRITDAVEQGQRFGAEVSRVTSPAIIPGSEERFLLSDGDIVVARTGATVGTTLIYRASMGRTVFAGFLIRMRLTADADPSFMYYVTLTDSFKRYVQTVSQRSGQPGLNTEELRSFFFSSPPLREQQQIGEFFTAVDSAINAEEEKLLKFKNLRVTFLAKMLV